MKNKRTITLIIGILVLTSSGVMGMKAYNHTVYKNEILEFTSNVSEGKYWRLIREIKVPHSTFYAGFLDEDFGMTVGYHGKTFTTSNGGQTWREGINKANCRFGLDLLNHKYLWTVGNYGGNRVSKNGGKTLFDVTDLPLLEELPNNLVDILDEKNIVAGSPLRLAYTIDGGTAWTDIQLPDELEKLAGMSFLSLDKGFIMDYQGNVYYTENRGTQWTKVAKMPVETVIRFDETPSVAMRVNANHVMTVVYADKNEGIYSYQADLSDVITNQPGNFATQEWHKVQLEDRPRAIAYLSKEGLYLTTVDIVGNIHLFKLEKE